MTGVGKLFIVALLVALVCVGSLRAMANEAPKARKLGQTKQKVLEFLRKSMATRDGDDHDHDHYPEPAWFIDALYANLTNSTVTSDVIPRGGLDYVMKHLNIKNEADDHDHDHDHDHDKKCFTSSEVMEIFLGNLTEISKEDFRQLCPSLIYMALEDECQITDAHDHDHESCVSTKDKYLYGALSVVIISVTSLISILIVGRIKSSRKSIILSLKSLAMGTLLSDALIHLIPSALGLHVHSADEHDHDHDHGGVEVDEKTVINRTIVILATIVFFWLLDTFVLNHNHDHDGPSTDDDEHGHDHEHGHSHNAVTQNGKESIELGEAKPEGTNGTLPSNNKDFVQVKTNKSLIAYIKSFDSMAWIAFFADAVHNLTDGLAIGAAFSSSLSLGVSTALAILFHEIPHEIGEYGVLVSSGLSHLSAVLCNIISATICLIAFFIIASVSQDDTTREWIFAVTTGVFLYISLVKLMPGIKEELKHCAEKATDKFKVKLKKSILTLGFFAFGCIFMILLAIFEDSISLNVSSDC